MTTKKKAQKGRAGKAAPVGTPEQMIVVTPDEAEQLVLQIRDGNMDGSDRGTDETVGAFLLLLHSMAYCPPSDRENYLRAAERALMTYTFAFQHGAERLRRDAYESVSGVTLKEGGE